MEKKLIEWTDLYSVDFDDIDEQHKKLINIINKMFTGFSDGTAVETLNDIVDELISYTQYHFDLEEKYFKKYSYPELEEHIKLHQGFVEKVIDFKNDVLKGKKDAPYEVFSYIKKWLTNHILVEDIKYSKYFKSIVNINGKNLSS